MSRRTLLFVLAAAILLPCGAALAQPTVKPIGFGMQVERESFLSTTVSKAVITEVMPDSQALAGGVAVGDELVKVQGVRIPGNSALALMPHLEFVPGEPKTIVFRRANGSEYEVTFVRAVGK